jgi:predicted phage tail protein
MTTQVVHFKGALERFGETFTVSIDKPIDIFKLLDCQISGFRAYLIQALEAGLDLAIVSKNNILIEEPAEIFLIDKNPTEYYISLVPAGSGWFGKILAAVAIAVVSYFTFGSANAIFASASWAGNVATNLYMMAALVAIAGIVELLTKTPKTKEEEKGPGIFDGPENTIKSGQPVPILYGQLLIGGAPIHVDISSAEQKGRLPTNPDPSNDHLQNIVYVPGVGTIVLPNLGDLGGAIGAGVNLSTKNRVKNYR